MLAVAETIKELLKLKNISQVELAEKLGIDAHYISDIECGSRNITFKTLARLTEALEIDPYKFFTYD